MADQQAPTPGPTLSPDGRWWWDGARWVPVPAKPPMSHHRRTLIAGVVVLGLVVAFVGLYALGELTPSARQANAYTTMTDHDLGELTQLTNAYTDCIAARQGWAACRPELQRLDDRLALTQGDLERTPAPACLHDADMELRSGLADARGGAEILLRAGPADVALANQAIAEQNASAAHMRRVGELRQAANC